MTAEVVLDVSNASDTSNASHQNTKIFHPVPSLLKLGQNLVKSRRHLVVLVGLEIRKPIKWRLLLSFEVLQPQDERYEKAFSASLKAKEGQGG